MLLSSHLRKLSITSALATLVCTGASSGAYAAVSSEPLALSSDGTTLLYMDYDRSTGTSKLELIDTKTGNITNLSLPATGDIVDRAVLSADGKTVVGTIYSAGSTAFSWTAAGGYVYLGSLNNSNDSEAIGVSADGSAIAGTSDSQAFYWKQGQMTGLGFLSGGFRSYATAISADGSTVVGSAETLAGGSLSQDHAFIWNTTTQAMQDIAPSWYQSEARFVSSDGSVVAGTGSVQGAQETVFRWSSSGLVDIGTLPGGGYTDIAAMSSNGDVLVGTSGSSDGNRAYRYVAATATMTNLGTLGGNSSNATGASADGSIVIGFSEDASNVQHGFRWTDASHMITVDDWIRDHDIDIGNEITKTADFISASGNVIIGETVDNTTYIARVADQDDGQGGTGIIDTSKFLPTIASANNVAVQYGIYSADTIMFGAQGEPMRNLLAPGQKSVWGTIDGGHDDSHVSKGGLGLGEFGFGYGIADGVTARFAGGGTYTKQDLDSGGDVRQRGFYLSPEVSADIGRNVYVTLGGYWGRGSIDSHRGYLNGAEGDYSDGSTNSQTWGAKIRFDWLNAATLGNTAITPYGALSFAHTKVDGFSEDNGSFPVSYDATDDHATIARIGADFVHPLTDKVRLLAKAEADYQFEDHAASTNGTIIGVSDFTLPGQDLKHFWLRGGLGAEFDVGKASTASVMVNATTQGQDPNFWVRTNFTVKF